MKKILTVLILCVVALCILGLIMLYSTAFKSADMLRFRAQLNCLGAGLILVPLLVRMDYGWLNRRPVLYALGGICFVLLIAVFIPGVGIQTNGANRWVRNLGQPSEFTKPMVITLLAAYLAGLAQRKIEDLKQGFLIPLLLGGVPALLIFFEPDWGTATLLGILTLAMLLIAGARWSYLAITITSAVSLLIVLVAHNPLRLERFLVFLDPEAHRHGAGWQIWQSLLAIGSGGLWGHFLDGSLHKYGYVPEQQTDFIFACIGEETGLWGSSLVVLLYLGILLCGLQIMQHARDRFGHFLAAGCTIVITLQACINLAVATSLVTNKGLPLPFMSYGGSSLLAMFICVGLLGSVAWHSRANRDQMRNAARSKPAAVQLALL
jgi:cell division protein FtsW